MPAPPEAFSDPWVFLSYSTRDSVLAGEVRDFLTEKNIRVWQDVRHADAGVFLHHQIPEAIRQVEHLVVLITRDALTSPWVRDEMHWARQQGVCLLPLVGDDRVKPSDLPPFLGKRLCLVWQQTGDKERLVARMRQCCDAIPYTWMVPDQPEGFVERKKEYDALKAALLAPGAETVAISTALVGAGGFGKTWLAIALCHDQEIRDRYVDGTLWITLGEAPGKTELLAKMGELLRVLGEKELPAGFDEARSRLSQKLEKRDILLVIDDAWRSEDLEPFLQGGGGTVRRLITSRMRTILPKKSAMVEVDAMRPGESSQVLTSGLPQEAVAQCGEDLRTLAKTFGHWPLLLALANGFLGYMDEGTYSLEQSLADARAAWEDAGPTAFDPADETDRRKAAGVCIDLSLRRLASHERERFLDLAIFPEDVAMPTAMIARLWRARGGFKEHQTRPLLARLRAISLLNALEGNKGEARLHDVIRTHLRTLQRGALPAVHGAFLNSFGVANWHELRLNETYLWRHLQWHLEDAGRGETWRECIASLPFLAAKGVALRSGPAAVADLVAGVTCWPDDSHLVRLLRRFRPLAHQLGKLSSLADAMNFLDAYFRDLPERETLMGAWVFPPGPRLTPRHSLPDIPDPTLLMVLSGHEGEVRACTFSPDGRTILSASNDQTLRLWDSGTGQALRVLTGHKYGVTACAFSPDGRTILSASADKTLCLWDVGSDETLRILTGHGEEVTACAFSPDGQTILSASVDKTLRLWDAGTGKTLRILTGHKSRVTDCAFSPDGRTILSASADKTLLLWDAGTGKTLRDLTGHKNRVTACTFSPDGQTILSASWDRTLRLWDAGTGQPLRILTGHEDWVMACAFSPDGRTILSVSRNNTLRLWDAGSGQTSRVMTLLDAVKACAFSPDGEKILLASCLNLQLWGTGIGETRGNMIGHDKMVTACTFSPDGRTLLSVSEDLPLRLWDAMTGQTQRIPQEYERCVSAVAFSPNGGTILSAALLANTLYMWDMGNGQTSQVIAEHNEKVTVCAFSPDGRTILSALRNTLCLWNTKRDTEPLVLEGHNSLVMACAFSPDSRIILSASLDKTLCLWDAKSGQNLRVLTGHTNGVQDCAFSPDGRTILSASWDHTLRLWDAGTYKILRVMAGHESGVTACAFSRDGALALSASEDQTLRLWDLRTGQCLHVFPVLHPLSDCAFSPDGQHVAACGEGGVYFLRLVEGRGP